MVDKSNLQLFEEIRDEVTSGKVLISTSVKKILTLPESLVEKSFREELVREIRGDWTHQTCPEHRQIIGSLEVQLINGRIVPLQIDIPEVRSRVEKVPFITPLAEIEQQSKNPGSLYISFNAQTEKELLKGISSRIAVRPLRIIRCSQLVSITEHVTLRVLEWLSKSSAKFSQAAPEAEPAIIKSNIDITDSGINISNSSNITINQSIIASSNHTTVGTKAGLIKEIDLLLNDPSAISKLTEDQRNLLKYRLVEAKNLLIDPKSTDEKGYMSIKRVKPLINNILLSYAANQIPNLATIANSSWYKTILFFIKAYFPF